MLFHGGERRFSFGCHGEMLWVTLEQISERMQNLSAIGDESAVIVNQTNESAEAFD